MPSKPVALLPAQRLVALRRQLSAMGLHGVIIPRFDAYQGEVVAPHDQRLGYVSGFTGSAGIALVTADRALLFVDGRYQVQARREVDLSAFEIEHFYDAPLEQWLSRHTAAGQRVGVNTMLVPGKLFDSLKTALEAAGGELVGLEADLVDAIWPDQPEPPLGAIKPFPLAFAGEDSATKRGRIAAELKRIGADLLVETQPDNIAWLLNIRGSDIAHTPVAHSAVLLDDTGAAEWFVDARKLPNDQDSVLSAGLNLRPAEGLLDAIAERASGRTVAVDPAFAPVAVRQAVERAGGGIASQFSPVTMAKAIKNPVELDGFRSAHVEDGIAWVEFIAWLMEQGPKRLAAGNPINEMEAQAELLKFRQQREHFVEESFAPIAASGSNAAMCHYSAKPSTNAPITAELPFLIDTGGQYFGGTTDATRTIMLGRPSADVRRTYTAVLQGFIALMTAQFPVTATGHYLDALARRPLWDLGLDFDHGTGHGVGHFLSVHEHPHRFGKTVNTFTFEPGVIMTIEPGYYQENGFGLRVENQVEVVAGAPGFLRFATLTLVPIDLSMADAAQLNRSDIAYLDAYHAQVRAALTGRLSQRAEAYLVEATAPLHEQLGALAA
ncbi:aminopeptidase P family protein [Devosia lacusdianchii]|uniref:aminopeptidase P family protein n=1 Tax=Devosia lacusdianchii TaxID=2917991 RepID=UPI001F07036C|nr:aminopeptidase P family protein [Devosia sp. JXJ CY 41]